MPSEAEISTALRVALSALVYEMRAAGERALDQGSRVPRGSVEYYMFQAELHACMKWADRLALILKDSAA